MLYHFFPTLPSAAPSCLHDWTLPWRISAPVYAFVFPLPRLLSPPLPPACNSSLLPSISKRVINHPLKYGVNCRKLQITIFIGHARTRVHTPAAHWVIVKYARQVVRISFLILRPLFSGRKDISSRNLSKTHITMMCFLPQLLNT